MGLHPSTQSGTVSATTGALMTMNENTTSNREELRNRIEAKRHRLEAEWKQLKADGREAGREREKEIKAQLEELQQHVGQGWDRLSETVAGKLNEWLKRS
jgi:hypothetical protein